MKKRVFLAFLCLALVLTAVPAGAAEAQDWEVVWLEPELAVFSSMSEGLLEVDSREGNHLGYVDRTGRLVIPMDFASGAIGCPFSEGLAGVGKKDPETGEMKFGFIDHKGKTVIPFIYDDAMGFSEGLACVGVERTGRNGMDHSYIDKTGAEVIPPNDAYDVSYGFSEGLASVRLGGILEEVDLWGFIDKTGKLVVPVEYDDVSNFSEGLAAVGKYDAEGTWQSGYLAPDGTWALVGSNAVLEDFSEGLAVMSGYNEKGEWKSCYIDKTGSIVLPLEYDGARAFHEGRAQVMQPDENGADDAAKFGFIDRAGELVVPSLYDDAQDFSEGLAAVCQGKGEEEKWGFIDRFGREAVPLIFDSAQPFSEGVAVVEQDGRYGLLTLRRTAYARTQSVEIDGRAVPFEMYALRDGQGGETNYVKVRDVALTLQGTPAQFAVDWNGGVDLTPGQAYTPNGSELTTPYAGDRAYQSATALTQVGGAIADLDAIVLQDDQGGGYTYYKLRDLGKALGFQVGWSQDRGVYIETDKPYRE